MPGDQARKFAKLGPDGILYSLCHLPSLSLVFLIHAYRTAKRPALGEILKLLLEMLVGPFEFGGSSRNRDVGGRDDRPEDEVSLAPYILLQRPHHFPSGQRQGTPLGRLPGLQGTAAFRQNFEDAPRRCLHSLKGGFAFLGRLHLIGSTRRRQQGCHRPHCRTVGWTHIGGMNMSETYRRNAAKERELAAACDLPNRRSMHEKSAETWDAMAAAAEETADMAITNAAAKAAA